MKAEPRSSAPLRIRGSQPGAHARSPLAVNNGNTRASGASRWNVRIWVAGGFGMAAVLHSGMRAAMRDDLRTRMEYSHCGTMVPLYHTGARHDRTQTASSAAGPGRKSPDGRPPG